MKNIFIGIGIYILGFIIAIISSSFWDSGNVEYSYYYGIIFSVLYLASVVGVCTSLIIKHIKEIKN